VRWGQETGDGGRGGENISVVIRAVERKKIEIIDQRGGGGRERIFTFNYGDGVVRNMDGNYGRTKKNRRELWPKTITNEFLRIISRASVTTLFRAHVKTATISRYACAYMYIYIYINRVGRESRSSLNVPKYWKSTTTLYSL